MDPFRAYVRELAKKRGTDRIRTSSQKHAIALFEAMFGTANQRICIFTGELHPGVFGSPEVVDAAGNFLAKGATLNVLVQVHSSRNDWRDHPFLRGLTSGPSHGRGIIQVRGASGSYARDTAHHFAVFDGRGYRFEVDHESAEAIASFNEPGTAVKLESAFNEAFELGKHRMLFEWPPSNRPMGKISSRHPNGGGAVDDSVTAG